MENNESLALKLPVIDISPFSNAVSNGNTKAVVAAQLHEACSSSGAFYVTGHGIDTSALQGRMRSFFHLNRAQKKKIAVTPGGFTRGYIGMGEESGSDQLEVKEAFSFGYPWPAELAPENNMQGSNVWLEKGWMQVQRKL